VPVRLMCEAHQCVFGRRQEEKGWFTGTAGGADNGPRVILFPAPLSVKTKTFTNI